MSTGKPLCRCSGTAQEALSLDLLLEVVALADVATVVRCAATGRILRRAILDPAFRRRRALAADDGFDPALLLGVSYLDDVYSKKIIPKHRVIHTPAPTKLRVRLDDHGLRDFNPVASRNGLFVLRRHGDAEEQIELRACDTFTGHVTSLPSTTLPDASCPVVLSIGDARRSFELLVADKNTRFHRTFSSKDDDGQWSAVREVSIPQRTQRCLSYCSAVIGRTVYLPSQVHATSHFDHILALDVDSGEATMMELPAACFSRMVTSRRRDAHLLLATVRRRLCLLVAESHVIAMWTLTSSVAAGTWSRKVVISNLEIARQAGLDTCTFTLMPFKAVGFGERSSALILNWSNTCEHPLLRLDLGTKDEAAPPVVTKLSWPEVGHVFTRLFLHEIDLLSLLQAMKSF